TSRVADATGCPVPTGALMVLQVAVRGQRAEVDPAAHVGVAEEAVVRLVRVPEDDALLDFAVDLADGPDGDGGHGAAEDGRAAADVGRAGDLRERRHGRALVEPHGPVAQVDDRAGLDLRAGA